MKGKCCDQSSCKNDKTFRQYDFWTKRCHNTTFSSISYPSTNLVLVLVLVIVVVVIVVAILVIVVVAVVVAAAVGGACPGQLESIPLA
jgi:uncharacterized membrane protein